MTVFVSAGVSTSDSCGCRGNTAGRFYCLTSKDVHRVVFQLHIERIAGDELEINGAVETLRSRDIKWDDRIKDFKQYLNSPRLDEIRFVSSNKAFSSHFQVFM